MPDKPAYHYTTLEALHGIILSRRFRLGNVFFMNDSMEVDWLFGLARQMMERRDAKRFAPLLDRLRERRLRHIFCGCFSLKKDDLSQWRGYADDGRGVAIEVHVAEIARRSRDHVEVAEVIYSEEAQRAHVDRILRDFLAPRKAGGLAERLGEEGKVAVAHFHLSALAVRCKNPAFGGESEVRLVLQTAHGVATWQYDEELDHEFFYGIDLQLGRGTLVPFAQTDLPLEAIRGIWLGPRFGDDMAKTALQLFLSKQGVPDDVVENLKRSRASYRG
jgi:hypothetical protein